MIKPNRSIDFSIIQPEYNKLLASMEYKNDSWEKAFKSVARKIAKGKNIYVKISNELGGNIPWQFIGVIHNLESGCNFNKHLHNGDSLSRRTVRVPANRPPTHYGPFTFIESAIDALKMKGFHRS